jgi:CubicO group peptidase (beta-lactamase class C family)
MPVGNRKNLLYGLALPLLGRRCRWRNVTCTGERGADVTHALQRALRRHHAVGGCIQCMAGGRLTAGYHYGNVRLSPDVPVTPETFFRTASIAKMACALLVMRLQTLGKLDVEEDISALWGAPIRNPNYPETPIALRALLSHTSGLADSPLYYSAYRKPVTASAILADPATYTGSAPYQTFRYSNFAAGLVGCLLEKRFGRSLESLAQALVFGPLGARATFDIASLGGAQLASSYRVLPAGREPAFDAPARLSAASPLDAPDPENHYLLASGSLFVTAEGLMRLCLPLVQGAEAAGEPFIDARAVRMMTAPTADWPEPEVRMRHGAGMLEVDDRAIYPHRLNGHQGFAYGAVNGVFFDGRGNGFASLNSGASERRVGHLSCLNRDLIRICMEEGAPHG